jgi:hypothetical protein
MSGALAGNRGKLIVIVALLLVAAVTVWFQVRGSGGLRSNVNFVCVATGKMYSLDRRSVFKLPWKNPDTGEETLLPCGAREDGSIEVSERYREAVRAMGEKNRYVDPETLVVKTAP